MELTKFHPQTAHKLAMQHVKAPDLRPFLSALNSKKVDESADLEVLIAISEGISQAIFNLGHQAKNDSEYKQLCNTVFTKVRHRFAMLTLDEIKLACEYGAEGVYGEVMGVNVIQILKWLNGFKADLKRHNAKKELLLAQEVKEEPKEVTEEKSIEIALNAFETYKRKGNYDDYGNIIYDFLERKKVINFSDQRKNEIKEAVLKMELTRLSAPLNLDEKRRFEREKNDLLNNPKDLKGMFKRHALNVFFADLCEMGADLEMPHEGFRKAVAI